MGKKMTRKEAEILAEELNEKEPQWFCPLINGNCRTDCINFVLAFVENENEETNGMIHDAKDDNFVVEGYVCSNNMFLGNPPFICGEE